MEKTKKVLQKQSHKYVNILVMNRFIWRSVASEVVTLQYQFNTDLFISVLCFRDLRDGLSGDHQEVSGSLRGHIMEGNTLIHKQRKFNNVHYTFN